MQAFELESLMADQRSLLQALTAEVRSLQKQITLLKSEVRQQPMLGFSDGRDYIIIERDKNILWHRFEGEEPIPIKSKILKGYLKRVIYIDKEYPKLHVFIEGDREYVLVTGFETHFARELLAAIVTMKLEDLNYPVIIKPDTGNDDSKSKHKPVFCNVIHRGKTVKPGALRNQDIHQLFKQAEAILQYPLVRSSVQPEPLDSDRQNGVGSAGPSQYGKVAQFPQPQSSRSAPTPELPNLPPTPLQRAADPVQQSAVDWVAVCQDLHISSKQLKEVARRLQLPHGKLTQAQSAQLYQTVYQQYGEAAG